MTTAERAQLREIVKTFEELLKEYRNLTIELTGCITRLKAENKSLRGTRNDIEAN